MRHLRKLPLMLLLIFLIFGCAEIKNIENEGEVNNEWTSKTQVFKQIKNYDFIFPGEGYAYEKRDSLVQECLTAIEENMKLVEIDTFNVPYKIVFYPSKAAMKDDLGYGYSGAVNDWTKTASFVATDNIETIKKENIVAVPIKHELMHMIVLELWGRYENSSWLNEGLATYANNNCNDYSVAEIYKYLFTQEMLIPIDSLVNDFYATDEIIGYHQSAYIVQYLIEQFGIEKFSRLWKEGFTSFEEIYKISFSEMESSLKAELQEKIPNTIEIDWESFKIGCK